MALLACVAWSAFAMRHEKLLDGGADHGLSKQTEEKEQDLGHLLMSGSTVIEGGNHLVGNRFMKSFAGLKLSPEKLAITISISVTIVFLIIGSVAAVLIKHNMQSREAETSEERPRGKSMRSRSASLVSGAQGDEGLLMYEQHVEAETEQPDEEQPADGLLSKFDVTANFVISALGAGLLVFPRVMADTGYIVASILITIATAAALVCGLAIIQCCDMAERAAGSPKGSLSGYEAMVEIALGETGKYALTVSKNLFFIGIIVVYFTIETESIQSLLPDSVQTYQIRWFMVLPVFVALSMLRDLTVLAKFATVGIIAAFFQIFGICGGSLFEIFQPGAPKAYHPWAADLDVDKVGAALSTFVFGFGLTATVPTVRSQMANPDELPWALMTSVCLVFIVYMVAMWIGYLAFSDGVHSNIITSIDGRTCEGLQCHMGKLSASAVVINLFISVPTFQYCLVSALQNAGIMFSPMSLPNLACRALLIVALCFVSYMLSYAQQIIAIMSAIFAVCNGFLFPIGCYHSLKKQDISAPKDEQSDNDPERKVVVWTYAIYAIHAIVVIVAMATMIFGVKGGVTSLMEAMNAAKPA
eukprot:TRINITY_DN77232_c0_g1_i1.p1 TRINITY_DN77232_c0_g1~~TRINITY_DN77232_c0_g1_i1.p1  ORF type:complete len:610 (-),score=73.16 TRINITY_DN77232_c0_g1_i1:67-1824(-)